MARQLTKKQKAFADKKLEIGKGVQAALETYNTTDYSTAGNIASENLKKPKIIEYLEGQASAVANNMVRLALKARNEQVQVNAGKDVLDRAGYKTADKLKVEGNLFEALNEIINERRNKATDK